MSTKAKIIVFLLLFIFVLVTYYLWTYWFGLLVLGYILGIFTKSCFKFYGAKNLIQTLLSRDYEAIEIYNSCFSIEALRNPQPPDIYLIPNRQFKRGVWYLLLQNYSNAKEEFEWAQCVIKDEFENDNKMKELYEKCNTNIAFCKKPFIWSSIKEDRKTGGYISYFLEDQFSNQRYYYPELGEDIEKVNKYLKEQLEYNSKQFSN